MGFTFENAISYLYNSTNYENFANYKYERFEQDLSELRSFLNKKGFLNNLPVAVHIAGSKGKGSVAFLLEQVLLQSSKNGKLVFPLSFTSPHYLTLMERLRFAGQNIAEEVFVYLMHELIPTFEEFRESGRGMTFFEMMVTLFFKASQYYQPDALIVETGLGGRLDGTNVFNSEIAVITTIEREHTQLLGETIKKIAFEKAGILKKDQIVILAPQVYREATQVLLEQANIKQVKKIINIADVKFTNIREYSETVVNTVTQELSAIADFKLPEQIKSTNLTGRQEKRTFQGIEMIIDSAHTENSMNSLSQSLAGKPAFSFTTCSATELDEHSSKECCNLNQQGWAGTNSDEILLLIGLNVDKHKIPLLQQIPASKHIITCAFESARCLAPLTLAQSLISLYPDRNVEVCPNSETALNRAVRVCKNNGLRRIIVAGSVYLAGEILKQIK